MSFDEEMKSINILTLLWKFEFPAILGVITACIQEIIDGFFVGNVIGSKALAGITLAYPLYVVIIAIGLFIGIGSSSLIALERGKGNTNEALDIMHNTFSFCLLAGAVLTIGGFVLCETSVNILGAGGPALTFAHEYLRIIFVGSVFMVLTLALDPLVRNEGKQTLCLKIMVGALVAHVFFNYLLVMRMGMGKSGVAIATVISFALPALLLMYYLFGNEAISKLELNAMRLKTKTMIHILQAGLSSFLMPLSLALVLFTYNYCIDSKITP